MKQPVLFAFLFLLGLAPRLGLGQSATSTGLVARFALDELPGATTTRDATAQQGNGVFADGSGVWQPTGGYDGGGALLLTNSAHLDVPLNWQPAAFSFSFWLNPTRLYDYGQLTGAKARWGAFLFHSAANGQIYAGTDLSNRIVTQAGAVQANVWQHFVFTFANGVGNLYKNGKLLSSKSGMAASQPWQGMSLGYNGAEGIYDEVRVYNRAISAQEAAGLCGHYEAEEIPSSQLVRANIGSSNGVTYAENLTQAGSASQAGSTVPFSVSVPEAGIYTITARYAAATSYVRTMSVYVNGVDVAQAQFPTTGSWSSWSRQNVKVALQQGTNTIAYRYDADDNGWVNLDYIDVNSAISPGYVGGSAASPAPSGGITVDKFTGTARLNVPLFAMSAPGLTVPVGLAYAATGVRVADDGGQVGVNWFLQADLSIRRVVRGLPDDIKAPAGATDSRYGWLYTSANSISGVPDGAATASSASCTTGQQQARTQLDQLGALQRPASGGYTMYDTEPDIFYYNVPGHAGKFVLDNQGQAHTIPYDPITITWQGPLASLETWGIPSFTIRTAEGATYVFAQPDKITQSTSALTQTPQYFLRDYLAYYLPSSSTEPNALTYATAWHASYATSPTGGYLGFEYQTDSYYGYDRPTGLEQHRLLRGNGSGLPAAEYQKTTRILQTCWLKTITSPTAKATFELIPAGDNAYAIQSISLRLTAPLAGNDLLKRYTLAYTNVVPDYSTGRQWFDEQGTLLDGSKPRRFLTRIDLSTSYATEPLYRFTYSQLGTQAVSPLQSTTVRSPLPPLKAVDQDYWGFYNANGAKTLIPQLYLYPQLTSVSPALPGAPYRLFDLGANSTYASTGTQLTGADRRPAVDFTNALAGALTEVTFSSGGKAQLEYEPHRFFDAYAQQSLPAGGLRIRTLKLLDPVAKVETRRDYGYQLANGRASGVLLHAPRFAFAVPTTGSGTQQWLDATVRYGEDIAADPLERRPIGYQRVTETLPGQGQVVAEFSAAGAADDVTAGSGTTAWQRPIIGLARRPDGNGNCSTVAPLPAGPDLYPFALASPYDYQRGLPQRIQYLAEPVGTTVGALVRQQVFTYQYRELQPAIITGIAYEQAGSPGNTPYLYAKSSLTTGYQYVPREELLTVVGTNGATSQFRTVNRYNSQGWLAATASQNSDGSYQRTRTRYVSDYAVGTSTNPARQALYQRRTAAREQISSDVVETVSELVTATGEVRFQGSTIQTFIIEPARGATPATTRPYQLWRRTAPLPLPLSSSIDSTSLPGDGPSAGPAFQLVATAQEVDAAFTPISNRLEAGRQVQAQHLGYDGTLPVLQLANAKASEAVFSDFETTTDYRFTAYNAQDNSLNSTSLNAARTGKAGVELPANGYLTTALPISAAPRYRLVWWGRATQAGTFTVSFSGATPPATQQLGVNGTNQWQRFEVFVDLKTINAQDRGSYALRLLTTAPVQIDDIVLLPADAVATSTTYDLTLGKTSETDDRGRTSYYDYNLAGRLSMVRDHNQAIIRQVEQVVAGRRDANTLIPSFGVEGDYYDGSDMAFTAFGPRRAGLEYQWDFGDGSTSGSFSTAAVITHRFNTGGPSRVYQVELRIRLQGTIYRATQAVAISRQPLRVPVCIAGIVGQDVCNKNNYTVNLSCNPNAARDKTTYLVQPSVPGSYTYTWEVAQTSGGYISWTQITGPNINGPEFVQSGRFSDSRFRCRIYDSTNQTEVITDVVGIEQYNSCP